MSDIEIDGRFFCNSPIGNVQAWGAYQSAVSVSVGFYADMKHAESKTAYISSALFLTSKDARDLAATLIAAADFADGTEIDATEMEAAR